MRDPHLGIECLVQLAATVLLALNHFGGIRFEPRPVVEKVVPEGL